MTNQYIKIPASITQISSQTWDAKDTNKRVTLEMYITLDEYIFVLQQLSDLHGSVKEN